MKLTYLRAIQGYFAMIALAIGSLLTSGSNEPLSVSFRLVAFLILGFVLGAEKEDEKA